MTPQEPDPLELTRREALWLLKALRAMRVLTNDELKDIGERIRLGYDGRTREQYYQKFEELNCLDRVITKLWLLVS